MSWSTLEEAATAAGCSRRTLERRVAAGEVPSCAEEGRRLVWLGPVLDPVVIALEQQGQMIETLMSEVRALRGQLERVSADPTADMTSNARTSNASPRVMRSTPPERRAGSPVAPRSPSGSTRRSTPAAVMDETEIEALIAAVDAHELGQKQILRLAGCPNNLIVRGRRGELRTARAHASWERLRVFLERGVPAAA